MYRIKRVDKYPDIIGRNSCEQETGPKWKEYQKKGWGVAPCSWLPNPGPSADSASVTTKQEGQCLDKQ